jgi:hypothetical protein
MQITAVEDLGGGSSETALAAIDDDKRSPDTRLFVMLASVLNLTVEGLTG